MNEAPSAGGLVVLASADPFPVVLERLRSHLAARGLSVFGLFDHAAAAATVGLTLRPTTVVSFGNPAVGTPVMDAAPTLALELPLRVLVYEATNGRGMVAYEDPVFLGRRHRAPDLASPGLHRMSDVLGESARHAVGHRAEPRRGGN